MTDRVAVVLFNLGGPDRPEAIRPFLFNLFNDPAIVRRPQPLRWALASLISRRRAPEARRIYAHLGGRSPLLEQTEAQARALEGELGETGFRVFVSMRYWHPRSGEVVSEVERFAPAKVVLLPLYPQFSSSTTASSFQDWDRAARGRIRAPTTRICCYPDEPGFAEAAAGRIADILETWEGPAPRILHSAHGVPKAFIAAGDPYRSQIERSVAAIRRALGREDLDHVICFQSRVGPLEWIRPLYRPRNRTGRFGGKAGGRGARRLRFRAFGNAGGTRSGIPEARRGKRRSGLPTRRDRRHRPGIYPRASPLSSGAPLVLPRPFSRDRETRPAGATPGIVPWPRDARHDLARGRLSLGSRPPHRLGDRLDGRHALSAEALRLSLWARSRQRSRRDAQDHGAPPAAGDRQPQR